MNRNEFARNLAAGTYGLVVLDVLRDGPDYGYGIVKRIFEQSRQTIRWRQGTLYPVLHRLEEQGLVTSAWKGPKKGRRRRYYQLTKRGRSLWREQRDQWRAFSRSINTLLSL
jgi:PadR family transcriptional regulator PadR